jgi:phospholipid/cholesterol/gamma-HCH transport system ATP-binding protein
MTEALSHQPLLEMKDAQIVALRDTSLVLLDNVNWTVRPGEFWVVAGPQRSGKSDLLLHAAGLIAPANGECRIFGRDTSEGGEEQLAARLRLGYVFADGRLFNHLTIAQNIALPLQYHRNLPETETAREVAGLLDLLELTPFAALTPGNVAAVWRQRAALARALVLQPELLLLDGPTGGLTPHHRRWLVDFLDRLWHGHESFEKRPVTIVVTTDDLHAWENPQRKFAAAHDGSFSLLGSWGDPDFMRHQAVQELLVAPMESEGNS